MHKFKIDYTYLTGSAKSHFDSKGEVSPAAYALLWCMTATSFNRIFTRYDLKEFLFRLAITLHSMELVESWLLKDRLMPYSFRGNEYILTLDDVADHFGIEVIDAVENCSTRENFMNNVAKGIKNAMFMGVFEGMEVIAPRNIGEGEKEISGQPFAPEITPEVVKKAEFFANDILKFIPQEKTVRSAEMLEKEKELEQRREKIKNYPVFDINKIPPETIKQCIEAMYAPKSAKEILEIPEDFETFGRPMIYLAWLYANNFLEFKEGTAYPVEGFDINYEDYELEDGGFNLRVTIEEHNFDEILPLLKGLY